MEIDHKTMSVVDSMRTIGELEHLRFHLLTAAAVAPEEEVISLLVLAKQCQDTRRKLQKKYFPDVEERHWCSVKSASTLLQILVETAGGDIDDIKEIKSIINQTVELATGVDISNCESCQIDKESV